MQSISEEFLRIESTKYDLGGAAFFSDAHKKTREWQVLGAVQKLLRAANMQAPVYAEEQEAPDFRAYTENRNLWAPIEIVEILPPDYQRHAFHKRDASSDTPRIYDVPPALKDPWEPLRQQLRKKSAMGYAGSAALIIYYDIGKFAFEDWDTSFPQQLLAEHSRQPFFGLSSFARVLVLGADMETLVQLSPELLVIADQDPAS